MSEHKYKFGDRVTYETEGGLIRLALVTMVTSCGRYVNLVWREAGADYVSTEYHGLTPGWPDPPDCVRVRAAVAVDTDGFWSVAGCKRWDDDDSANEARTDMSNPGQAYFIEALVPLPKQETIAGEVVS